MIGLKLILEHKSGIFRERDTIQSEAGLAALVKKTEVIFDMDGVLVDTEPVYVRMDQRLYNSLGIDITLEEQLSFVGKGGTEIWSGIKEKFNLHQPVGQLVKLEEEERYRELKRLPTLSPVDGVVELLDALQGLGVALAIASSSSRIVVELVVDRTNLRSYFDAIISGEQVGRGKPAPDIFLLASTKLGVESERCLVIEDSANGVAAAKAANMSCVGFSNPNSGRQDLSGADLVIADLSDANRERILQVVRSVLADVGGMTDHQKLI